MGILKEKQGIYSFPVWQETEAEIKDWKREGRESPFFLYFVDYILMEKIVMPVVSLLPTHICL